MVFYIVKGFFKEIKPTKQRLLRGPQSLTHLLLILATPPSHTKGEISLCWQTVPQTDLTETPLENSDLIFVVDGSYIKNETRKYEQNMLGQISSHRLECDPLLQARYAQMTEVNAFTRICQLASWLARDKRINIYKLRVDMLLGSPQFCNALETMRILDFDINAS